MLDQYTQDENELNDKESTEPQNADEVNTSEALDNEETKEISKEEQEEKDYSSLGLEDLLKELKELISGFDAQQIKKQVNEIKTSFNNQFGEILAEKKRHF